MNREVNINFIDGPFVEIVENDKLYYHVEFIDRDTNKVIFELDLRSNYWARCPKKYYVDWLIRIKGIDNDFYHEHVFGLNQKKVLVFLESPALGDTLAWMDQVEKFRIVNKCEVVCATHHNEIFEKQYPYIEFVSPDNQPSDLYASYRVGLWLKHGKVNMNRNRVDTKNLPLIKVGSNILGLEYEELKPKLEKLGEGKQKLVTIGFFTKGQYKYWNNPTGWQEVVDFLNSKGYEVRVLSNEEDGYRGNKLPTGVTRQPSGTLTQLIKVLQESELFIGISSGLSWLAWAAGTPTVIISGFTDVTLEPTNGVTRIINKEVCNSCWSKYDFDLNNPFWCPVHANTERRFECSKSITGAVVIEKINKLL